MDQGRKRDAYQAWLLGEVLLFGLLGASLALFVAYPSLRPVYQLPELRLVISTVIMLAAATVALLAGARFTVEGRRFDLLLASGFFVAAISTLAFAIVPVLDGNPVGRSAEWAGVVARVLAVALIAAAPLVEARVPARRTALRNALAGSVVAIAAVWGATVSIGDALPALAPGDPSPPLLLTLAFATLALLSLAALVGFGVRYRRGAQELDQWLALGMTFLLFAALHFVFTPLVSSSYVTQGDFLRALGYGVMLVGVWQAIRAAEFGRAVAEERARVAREIHDGVAQYLFAISTHAAMLESGTRADATLTALKEAAAAAQQEARFAVLALSSASGSAPFDAALRRYVDFLTADGALDVELEVDPATKLAPDEQIEVFRIVQEGLANVRKHAGATRADVRIGERGGRRYVSIRDDGEGFDGAESPAGQGLKNIRARAASIDGALTLRSRPGRGTAIEVTLRA